jgi:hypothetical protein
MQTDKKIFVGLGVLPHILFRFCRVITIFFCIQYSDHTIISRAKETRTDMQTDKKIFAGLPQNFFLRNTTFATAAP